MTGDPMTYLSPAVKVGQLQDPAADSAMDRITADRDRTFGTIVRIPGPTPATPGEAFAVQHPLGVIPAWVSVVDAGDHGGSIYADDMTDKPQWTASTVVVRCTVGSETNLAIRLTARPG